MHAKDIMTTRVVTVVEDTPVDEIARTLLRHRISAVPVVDTEDRLVGIVSEGDLIGRPEAEGRDNSWWLSGILSAEERAKKYAKTHGLLAKDVMTTDVVTADGNETLGKLAGVLEERGIKRVPIVHNGRISGIVSRANLLQALASLPEGAARAAEPTAPTAEAQGPEKRSIRASILNTIHNEIGVKHPINVIVSNGVVDLWGGVETEAQRQAIRSAAENTPNVIDVKDHITVLPPALRHLLGADRSD